MKHRRSREQACLIYPKHQSKPEDTLDFIELSGWESDCKRLGLTKEDQAAIRICIMSGPKMPPIVPGSGGVRKARFAPSRWRTGKRTAARICFAYFEEYSMVLLVMAYRKSDKTNLSRAELSAMKSAIRVIKAQLDQRPIS